MSSRTLPSKIDTHAHFLPPNYRQACIDNGHVNPDGMPHLPEWNPEAHLALMDRCNISKSILSISSPGTHLVAGDGVLAAKVTRDANSYAAGLKKERPDRFGYFASLPIPDVDLCLKEIELAADEGCDGYVVLTNGHGVYLGDNHLDLIFEELNRRHATLFVHPTTPLCICSPDQQTPTRAAPLASKFPNPMLEFFFDTARIVANLFLSGTLQRCPNINLILPHLGGAMPPLFSRFVRFSNLVPGSYHSITQEAAEEIFRKQVWFDLAGLPFPGQIKGLMQGCNVPHSRLLVGSDYPFTKAPSVETLQAEMDEAVAGAFEKEEIVDIYHGNAKRLLSLPKTH